MRLISFIFAVYFLALAVLPCADNDHCSGEGKSTTVTVQAGECQDTQHADELCSPLCMCHCCGGVTVVSNSDNNIIAQVPTEQLSIYINNSPSEISFSIWQPPKV